MPSVTVRNLSEETHHALKARVAVAGGNTADFGSGHRPSEVSQNNFCRTGGKYIRNPIPAKA